MAIFPSAVSTNADLYIGVNNLSTVLTDNPLTAGATTVNVSSTTGFPTVGIITIDLEAIHYTGVTATSFTGCTRGFDGTTGASHSVSTTVFHDIPAAHHNVLKDEIIAIETYLRAALNETAFGSAAAPAYSFDTDSDTGAYRSAVNQMSISVGGEVGFTVDRTATNIYADNTGTPLLRFQCAEEGITMSNGAVIKSTDGTVSLPAFSFVSDPTSGLYLSASNVVNFATNAISRAALSTTALTMALPIAMGSNKITGLSDGTVGTDGAAYGQVKILQAITGSTSTSASSTSSTYADTNLSATITPSSTSSQILIFVAQSTMASTTGAQSIAIGGLQILRDSTVLTTTSRGWGYGLGAALQIDSMRTYTSMSHLDSPSTTSPITYKTQFNRLAGSDGTVIVQQAGASTSYIVLMEVNGL